MGSRDFALGQLRHLYAQMVRGYVMSPDGAANAARYLLGPAIEILEQAQYVHAAAEEARREERAEVELMLRQNGQDTAARLVSYRSLPPQCEHTADIQVEIVRCIRNAGHDGEHYFNFEDRP